MLGTLFGQKTLTLEERRARFEQLMRNTHRQAHSFATRLTGSAADAEDLVQETYVRAFRFFHRYDESLPFVNWLYRIMSNAHIDSVRRRSKLRSFSLESAPPGSSGPVEVADASPNADRVMMDSAFGEDLQRALDAMNAEFRVAVLLADVEGMAYEEIAEVMQTSVGTVRSRIHRGRKQLRESLVSQNPSRYLEEVR
jgi:RNA polymerase sigma-70 factor (ECF subfamily)